MLSVAHRLVWEKGYIKNGQTIETPEPVYGPDVRMEFTFDFLRRHREQPFYFYFPTHLVHGEIHRTPDSKPDTKRFYNDDIAYAVTQVGVSNRCVENLLLWQIRIESRVSLDSKL